MIFKQLVLCSAIVLVFQAQIFAPNIISPLSYCPPTTSNCCDAYTINVYGSATI